MKTTKHEVNADVSKNHVNKSVASAKVNPLQQRQW